MSPARKSSQSAKRSTSAKRAPRDNATSIDESNPKWIDARPTKRFFIEVITRDITLPRAILDLVDNCVDGAIRLKGVPVPSLKLSAREAKQYSGLNITVSCDSNEFIIKDNCGGISLDVARHYAFKFGHDNTPEEEAHKPEGGSRIGLFGIGMKRALFKLGTSFEIESTSTESRFLLKESADKWMMRPSWDFTLSSFDERARRATDPSIGTKIRVSPLHPAVGKEAGRSAFATSLTSEIANGLQEFIRRGLKVNIVFGKTKVEVPLHEPKLTVAHEIQPMVISEELHVGKGSPVTLRMYVGVGPADLKKAGWYVFCNGRLVVGPDQTSLTGWQAREPAKTPLYHKQFDRFYGYVYFDCDDSTKLPWNTTKTGLDQDSALYQSVKDKMVLAMRPVIDMLNAVRKEMKGSSPVRPISRALSQAKVRRLPELEESKAFIWPKTTQASQLTSPKKVLVRFSRPIGEIDAACEYFGVENPDVAAEKAFQYWYKESK